MLDAILGAAINWVQNNTEQTACMIKQAYDSVAKSFGGSAPSCGSVTISCPHCGRKYEIDVKTYNRQLKGTNTKCCCSRSFYCP